MNYDEVALRRVRAHWPRDSRILIISSPPVRMAVLHILVHLHVDPRSLLRLMQEPESVAYTIDYPLSDYEMDEAEFIKGVGSSLQRILDREPSSLTCEADEHGNVILTYKP